MPIPTDPAAALHLVEIDIRLGGETFVMPVRTAADWIAATQSHNGLVSGYLPGLLADEDREHIAGRLIDGDLDRAEMHAAAWDLIAVGTGFDWWWVGHRLMCNLVAGWTQFGPRLVNLGHRFDQEPIAAAVLGMLGMIQEHAHSLEVADRQRIISDLCMPPPELPDWDEQLQRVGELVLHDTAIT